MSQPPPISEQKVPRSREGVLARLSQTRHHTDVTGERGGIAKAAWVAQRRIAHDPRGKERCARFGVPASRLHLRASTKRQRQCGQIRIAVLSLQAVRERSLKRPEERGGFPWWRHRKAITKALRYYYGWN
jgi:hypothetical protein